MYRVVISCAIHLRIKEDAWNQGGCRKESQARCDEQKRLFGLSLIESFLIRKERISKLTDHLTQWKMDGK